MGIGISTESGGNTCDFALPDANGNAYFYTGELVAVANEGCK
jgi:hypothetical protein